MIESLYTGEGSLLHGRRAMIESLYTAKDHFSTGDAR